MRNHSLRSGFLFVCLLLVLATPALPQGTSSFTTFEVPAAGTGALQGTTVIGIDTAGDVAGTYIDANTVHHGYIRAANGTITTFDVPGSVSTKGYGTFVVAMDPAGDVAGYYTVSQYGQTSGFVRTANGAIFSTFNASSYSDSTLVIGINSLGSITGEAYSVSGFSNSPVGFVGAANGAITTFAAPVPGQPAPDNYNTIGIAINTAGIIAGRYPFTATALASCLMALFAQPMEQSTRSILLMSPIPLSDRTHIATTSEPSPPASIRRETSPVPTRT